MREIRMPIEANLSQILARRVLAAATLGDWPLVKSLADVLINLQERDLVTEAGRAAWAHERVREVPLINPPMRLDVPTRCPVSTSHGGAHCLLVAGHEGGHYHRSGTGTVTAWDRGTTTDGD
jgi:hypothetical protein